MRTFFSYLVLQLTSKEIECNSVELIFRNSFVEFFSTIEYQTSILNKKLLN